MFSESELIPISAIQHFVFCKRQCALIHLEQEWQENRLTAEGRILHERVDSPGRESRRNTITARHVPLRSLILGMVGFADVVEYEKTKCDEQGVPLPGRKGFWRPQSVEYKRGKPKSDGSDEMQLCVQVMCLEEMHQTTIPDAYFFYGTPRRRHSVMITEQLRVTVRSTIQDLRKMLDDTILPPSEYGSKCRSCSLIDICLPHIEKADSGSRYWNRFFQEQSE